VLASKPMDVLEVPFVLVASPVMNDPNFARTVVLIGHFDSDGALGWIVNRVLDVRPADILPVHLAETVNTNTPIRFGGPVETSSLTVLVRVEAPDDLSTRVAPGLRSSLDPTVLKQCFSSASPSDGPSNGLMVVGYSGWSAGQLDFELTEGFWFLLPFSHDLAFPSDPEAVWQRAISAVGVRPDSAVMRSGGVH
jgi:putative transcriptional regulator